ncbi:MAG: UPF0158 family protein [Rhabdochlamydiaceae bacterium]|nr:UPF0158 family protein [Candidatus Amphrikana amoebophyrae]
MDGKLNLPPVTPMANQTVKAQNPLILRYHRMIEAFSKSDDERDFYLDKVEGFLLFIDLEKDEADLESAELEIKKNKERFPLVPKLTFYETKKFMEGFVNEKVYDIDIKEKLLDIISSREARENFLEFIYDHLVELDKWQQYYHERSRIRIIEWLRSHDFQFVFEEDLELTKSMVEKLKMNTFETKVPKDVQTARNGLVAKSKTYYSNEALNPRPKRGRPPKQVAKVEVEPQLVVDMYKMVPPQVRAFLFTPDYCGTAVSFSAKFDTEDQMRASLRGSAKDKIDTRLEMLSQRLESLRHISGRLKGDKDLAAIPTESDRKIMSAVTSEARAADEQPSAMSKIAQGLIPKKRGRPKNEDKDEPHKRVKRVTPIKYKKEDEE